MTRNWPCKLIKDYLYPGSPELNFWIKLGNVCRKDSTWKSCLGWIFISVTQKIVSAIDFVGSAGWSDLVSVPVGPNCTKPRFTPKACKSDNHFWSWTFFSFYLPAAIYRRRPEYGFGELGFKHRAQWVFWSSLSSGERTQWVPLSLSFVCQSELAEFFAELAEFAAELSI